MPLLKNRLLFPTVRLPLAGSIFFCLALSACDDPDDLTDDLTEPVGDQSMATGGQGKGSAGASAFDPAACPDSTVGFATEVISFEFGQGANFGQENFPEAVLHGPEGGGCCQGSLKVVSLGDGGHVVLGFGERVIVDGPGADFVIFENAFRAGGEDGKAFMELGTVAVSEDGQEWFDFPCDGKNVEVSQCAGVTPVIANVVSGEGDAFDAEQSGGDLFDLAELGLQTARYVRVTDFAGDDAIFDLDAAAILHGQCE